MPHMFHVVCFLRRWNQPHTRHLIGAQYRLANLSLAARVHVAREGIGQARAEPDSIHAVDHEVRFGEVPSALVQLLTIQDQEFTTDAALTHHTPCHRAVRSFS